MGCKRKILADRDWVLVTGMLIRSTKTVTVAPCLRCVAQLVHFFTPSLMSVGGSGGCDCKVIRLRDISNLLDLRPARREDDPEFVRLKAAIKQDFQPSKSRWVINHEADENGAVLFLPSNNYIPSRQPHPFVIILLMTD